MAMHTDDTVFHLHWGGDRPKRFGSACDTYGVFVADGRSTVVSPRSP